MTGDAMEFEVLGPVRARSADGGTTSAGRLQGLLLGMLLAHANHAVSVDRLVDAMWGDTPDRRAAHRLQTHVHRLRQTLGDADRIVSCAGGYRLTLAPGELDAERFESLIDEAREVVGQDPQRTVELARKSLTLWRGDPYEGLDPSELTTEARRLGDLKMAAIEELYAAELACGRHDVVSAELPALVERHPLRERLHELLMTSHALAGRQADALATYRHARSVLVDELGVEPGPQLRELEQRVLAGESLAQQESTSVGVLPARPAQLPAGIGSFVGRADELERLDVLLERDATSIAVLAITGSAGVGKTALALHWAHRVGDQFPDGQLYADLRGHGPDEPLPPSQVLAAFLRALGVDARAVPDDLAERSALLRSQFAGRRVLVVLDNARNAEQVRPLLPGTPSCAVVVTSRDVLTGLSVREGAHHVGLARMRTDEARRLVTDLLEHDHDPATVDALLDVCARLPLALRIAAERIGRRTPSSLTTLVADIEDARARLDVLDGGDDHTSVRGVFSWSYRDLDPDAAWVFRCFGVVPGPYIELGALAVVADLDLATTRRAIDTLVRAHLVEQAGADRYRLHDLLRSYATELVDDLDGVARRDAAFGRLCDHYLTTASAAVTWVTPGDTDAVAAERGGEGDTNDPFADPEAASYWLETERENLVLAAERAAHRGLPDCSMRLSALLWRYLDVHFLLDGAQRLHTAALTAARDQNDQRAEGDARRALGIVELRRDRFDRAEQHLLAALALHQQAGGGREAVATDRNYLGAVCGAIGRATDAIDHLEHAVAAYRELGHPPLAHAMNNLGLLHQRLGNHEQARSWLESSLQVSEHNQDPISRTYALAHLAAASRDLGDHDRALDCARCALETARANGHRAQEGNVLTTMGTIHQVRGELGHARERHREALEISSAMRADDLMAKAHNGLAEVAREAGELVEAVRHHETALDLAATDTWHERARAHAGLGDTCRELGDDDRAVAAWQQAYTIYDDLAHPAAVQVRARIDDVRGV